MPADSPRSHTPRSPPRRHGSVAPIAIHRRPRRGGPWRGRLSRRGSTTCASGSPKRTLYSSTFGPSWSASARRTAPRGSRRLGDELVERRLHQLGGQLLGPRPAPTASRVSRPPSRRCWARRRRRRRACSPGPTRGAPPCAVGQAQQRHLRAPQPLLDHDPLSRLAEGPARQLRPHVVDGLVDVGVTSTPLPAARPSVFTTQRPARLSRYASAASTSSAPNVVAGRGDAAPRPRPSCTPWSLRGGRRRRQGRTRAAPRPAAGRPGRPPVAPRARSRTGRRRSSRGASGPTPDPGVAGRHDDFGRAPQRPANACSRPPEPRPQTAHQTSWTYWSRSARYPRTEPAPRSALDEPR